MSFGPGLRCVSMTRGIGSSCDRTIWSLRERVEEGIWKRYKIGDSEVVARRFRFDYLFIFQVLLEYLFFRIELSFLHLLSFLCVLNLCWLLGPSVR
jgi:hypothetical protein